MATHPARLPTLKPRLLVLETRRVPTMQAGSWRTEGMTSTQRSYGYKWQQAGLDFLHEHPLCVMCEAEARVEVGTMVDHKIPHRGEQKLFWGRSNWQPLSRYSPRTKQAARRGDVGLMS